MLSDNGSITRGVCSMSGGILTGIKETKNIVKTATDAAVDSVAVDFESLVWWISGAIQLSSWMYPV